MLDWRGAISLRLLGSNISNRVLAISLLAAGEAEACAIKASASSSCPAMRVSSARARSVAKMKRSASRPGSSTISSRCHQSGISSQRTRRRRPSPLWISRLSQRSLPARSPSRRQFSSPSAAEMATSSKISMISTASITTRLSRPCSTRAALAETAPRRIASTEVPTGMPPAPEPTSRQLTAAERGAEAGPKRTSSGHCATCRAKSSKAPRTPASSSPGDSSPTRPRPTTIAPEGLCVGTSLKNSACVPLAAGYMPRLSRCDKTPPRR